MSELTGIEARISAALNRIAEGIGRLPAPPSDEEIERIKAEAAEEARAVASASGVKLAADLDAALSRAEAAERAAAETRQELAVIRGRSEIAERAAAKAREEIDTARAANAQLSESIAELREKEGKSDEQLEKRALKLQDHANMQARDLARLRRANAELRATIRAMREAAAAGEISGDTLNDALRVELDATLAQQAADRSELDAILAELTPLIQEKANV
jgi:chromosome segregation ATPase